MGLCNNASLETAELAKLLLLEGGFGFTETPTGQDDEKRRQYCYVLQSRPPTKSTRVLFTRRLLGSFLWTAEGQLDLHVHFNRARGNSAS
jgi:hypothetical protein